MGTGTIITIASLAVAVAGLTGTLAIAYLKEKTDTAKRSGSLNKEVENLGTELQKLQGVPQQITGLKGQIKAVDDRLNDLPEKVVKVDKRIQWFEDVCPVFHRQATGGCEEKKP